MPACTHNTPSPSSHCFCSARATPLRTAQLRGLAWGWAVDSQSYRAREECGGGTHVSPPHRTMRGRSHIPSGFHAIPATHGVAVLAGMPSPRASGGECCDPPVCRLAGRAGQLPRQIGWAGCDGIGVGWTRGAGCPAPPYIA